MSKLKNELTAIREALDTEHEYSGDYALQEEVANIRKLVENGAGSGAGVKVYPLELGETGTSVNATLADIKNDIIGGIFPVFVGAVENAFGGAYMSRPVIDVNVLNKTVRCVGLIDGIDAPELTVTVFEEKNGKLVEQVLN